MNEVTKQVAAKSHKDEQRLVDEQTRRQSEIEAKQREQERDLARDLEYELHKELQDIESSVEAEKRLVGSTVF